LPCLRAMLWVVDRILGSFVCGVAFGLVEVFASMSAALQHD
jgi:hypothetical protein